MRPTSKLTRRGLTLMELLVVLTILAATTAAVSVATDHVLAQRRFEISQQGLDDFQAGRAGTN